MIPLVVEPLAVKRAALDFRHNHLGSAAFESHNVAFFDFRFTHLGVLAMEYINPGDVVRLKGETQLMTVEAIENDVASCVWSPDGQHASDERFPVLSLEKVR